MWLVLDTSPHFVTTFSTPTSTSNVMHLDALQTIPPPPPSFEELTLMTLRMLIEKEKLVLEPIQQLQRCHGVIKSKLELNGLARIAQEQMK
jgi:hypothetical protein